MIEVARVRDVGLSGRADAEVLEWAAANARVILTKDKKTLVPDAFDRVEAGEPMPGVLVIRPGANPAEVMNDLLLIVECADPAELSDRVFYLPLS